MSSSFGRFFRISTFGESHCPGVGVVVDGVPSRMTLTEEDIQLQLDRRRPGGNKLGTERNEADQVKILSGVEHGLTLGTPIGMLVNNKDQRPGDYGAMSQIPRPSHADYTYREKYGIHASSGGGRSSARETIGRVAAGAIAEKFLLEEYGIEIIAWVSSVGPHSTDKIDMQTVTREQIDATAIRCPDQAAAEKMTAEIVAAREAKDSVGGVVSCVCRNLPTGLGEPVFDRLEAKLAHAMLSIPATKGFEIGSGFSGTQMRGSAHNDPFILKGDRLGTLTNFSGGVQGGISNAEPVYFRVAFKPPATIGQEQQTVEYSGQSKTLEAKGRHDP
ncbi:MAG: chorismate synthase, partial [Deltaproteobacteria bacterium]|nr:chorismate synthase [Deltaproteobacteria bacterium]